MTRRESIVVIKRSLSVGIENQTKNITTKSIVIGINNNTVQIQYNCDIKKMHICLTIAGYSWIHCLLSELLLS